MNTLNFEIEAYQPPTKVTRVSVKAERKPRALKWEGQFSQMNTTDRNSFFVPLQIPADADKVTVEKEMAKLNGKVRSATHKFSKVRPEFRLSVKTEKRETGELGLRVVRVEPKTPTPEKSLGAAAGAETAPDTTIADSLVTTDEEVTESILP